MENKVICSGCGCKFTSTNPDNYYQICSIDCRDIVENSVGELIDVRHAIRTESIWLQTLINAAQS